MSCHASAYGDSWWRVVIVASSEAPAMEAVGFFFLEKRERRRERVVRI